MAIPSLLFRTLVATFALLVLQYSLASLFWFTTSGELPARVADAVEARQTWRLHHSHAREVFTCLLCGHAVNPANGHGVHKDAYSCLQCNRTSFASECNATLPHKHYAHQIDMVVAAHDVPAVVALFLRSVLSLPLVSFHPVAAACVLSSLVLWLLYARFLYGVASAVLLARELTQLKRMQANIRIANARVPDSVSDSNDPVRAQLSFTNTEGFGDLRQRVVSPSN